MDSKLLFLVSWCHYLPPLFLTVHSLADETFLSVPYKFPMRGIYVHTSSNMFTDRVVPKISTNMIMFSREGFGQPRMMVKRQKGRVEFQVYSVIIQNDGSIHVSHQH